MCALKWFLAPLAVTIALAACDESDQKSEKDLEKSPTVYGETVNPAEIQQGQLPADLIPAPAESDDLEGEGDTVAPLSPQSEENSSF